MTKSSTTTPDIGVPDLRILPIGKLVPHELHDKQRATPLIERLREDGVLKNPPIVTPMDNHNDRFVVLDGANRIVALDVLGIPHIVVQVVPYRTPYVELHTWYHIISNLNPDDLLARVQRLEGLAPLPTDSFHAGAALARRAIIAYYILADGNVVTLAGGGWDVHLRTHLLNSLVDTYIHNGHVNRSTTDNLDDLLRLYPQFTAVVIFPKYDPLEVLELARSGARMPAGITRHIIQGRALRLNYPLETLAGSETLKVKNQTLRTWLQQKLDQKNIRYYAETTYLFDE